MITEYLIRGYKSLREVSLNTGRLNVLVGANACGKSTVLQTMLLLRQSRGTAGEVHRLQLSGGLFEAGTVRDVLHPEARAGIELGIRTREYYSQTLFSPEVPGEVDARQLIAGAPLRLPPPLLDESGQGFAYLNAERIGPRVVYQLPRPGDILTGPVGARGEFTTAFLARCRQSNRAASGNWFRLLQQTAEHMPEDLVLDEGSEKNLTRLDLAVKQVLAWIVPGIDFETSEQNPIDSAQLSYIRDPSGTRTQVRPTHMGFGVSYSLPLIAAGIALSELGLLLVENPEAHLQPLSQSRMGIFLALVASRGTQVFAETHSDHLVNGVRLAVKNHLLGAQEVRFFYFTKRRGDDSSSVRELAVLPDGNLSAWPEGFFDQIERDLARL